MKVVSVCSAIADTAFLQKEKWGFLRSCSAGKRKLLQSDPSIKVMIQRITL